jgi:hypothetical protein
VIRRAESRLSLCGLRPFVHAERETNVATQTKRGSTELIEQQPITHEHLEKLIAVLKEHDVEIVHWFPKGIPNPEVLYGAVKTRPEMVGKLVGKIVTTEGVRLRLDVFPLGIPFPDEVLIQFETPQGYVGG